MIVGIGIDVVDMDRIKNGIYTHILNDCESVYCNNRKEKIAGHIAVKEATLKALGHGLELSIGWLSVEVIHSDLGQPNILLHGKAKELAGSLTVSSSFVSISHDANIATAIVILERKG